MAAEAGLHLHLAVAGEGLPAKGEGAEEEGELRQAAHSAGFPGNERAVEGGPFQPWPIRTGTSNRKGNEFQRERRKRESQCAT